jgi:hypothetical protein
LILNNGEGDDFTNAYAISYECYNNRFAVNSTKDSTKEVTILSTKPVSFNKWYNLVFLCDSNYLSFYMNGELQGKSAKNFQTKFLQTDSLMIGHSASEKNERFTQGIFDDINIFHKILNENEINELYNDPNPNKLINYAYEFLKYGTIILIFVCVIVLLFFRHRKNLNKQREQLELLNRIIELELKVVKAQMNPHFISNCLASIQELMYENDIDKAGQYLAKFSYFLRLVLNYSDKNYISVSEEIKVINLNVELEQLRFKNRFDFNLIIDEKNNWDDILIPALITQTFIENSIWHGLLPLGNIRIPKLTISIKSKADNIIIEIEDNGVGRDSTKEIDKNSKGTILIKSKMDSLNQLSKTLKNKFEIVDLIDESNNRIGTKVILQFENII